MSSCHEWIAGAGTLSFYGKMVKKQMDKENMLEDTYRAKEIKLSLDEKIEEH